MNTWLDIILFLMAEASTLGPYLTVCDLVRLQGTCHDLRLSPLGEPISARTLLDAAKAFPYSGLVLEAQMFFDTTRTFVEARKRLQRVQGWLFVSVLEEAHRQLLEETGWCWRLSHITRSPVMTWRIWMNFREMWSDSVLDAWSRGSLALRYLADPLENHSNPGNYNAWEVWNAAELITGVVNTAWDLYGHEDEPSDEGSAGGVFPIYPDPDDFEPSSSSAPSFDDARDPVPHLPVVLDATP
eukprot:g18494.t1